MELLVIIITLALIFDYINGFHDAANSIATIVSTKVLTPFQAVIWAAFFNFVAFFIAICIIGGFGIANTVSKTVVEQYISLPIILSGVIAAIVWNLFTWWKGIPSSSSHALIGGLVGAAVAKAGTSALISKGLWMTIGFIVLSPTLGFILGSLMMLLVSWLFVKSTPLKVDRWFRRLQLVSASLYSLGHGGNDAQKTMGIIWMLLIAGGYSSSAEVAPPMWVILSCYGAIGLGTLFGGWRIVKTMGQKITKLKPVGGFCAETGGAITLFIATALGIPVSTTHTITGAIVGVGSSQKMSAVRWGVAGNIVWAWVLTIPASAFVAAIAWWIGTKIL